MSEGIEFIFTDDCSPDKSIQILKTVLNDYPCRFSQVKILQHKKNLGLAEARVTGLKAASGEYVIHCDSDDWVAKNMYELLYNAAQESQADIIGCDYTQVLPGEITHKTDNFSLNQKELVLGIISGKKVGGYLWNRLIRRDFYIKGAFRAKRGSTLFEDMAVTIPMHIATDKVAYVPQELYYYRCTNKHSMSANLDNRNIRSAINVFLKLHSIDTKPHWKSAIDRRLKQLLFSRITSLPIRNPEKWISFELDILMSQRLKLSIYENFTIWLMRHRLYNIQYFILICTKLVNPFVIQRKIKRMLQHTTH